MKHIKLIIFILTGFVLGGVVGLLIGVYAASEAGRQASQTLANGEQGYLASRFQAAYEHMEPTVAIWEGTNLMEYLKTTRSSETDSRENLASEILLTARLSSLFKEIGSDSQATYFAQKAHELFRKFDRSATYTADQIVENTLAKEYIKRTYTKQ
jgi:hypothetical protein